MVMERHLSRAESRVGARFSFGFRLELKLKLKLARAGEKRFQLRAIDLLPIITRRPFRLRWARPDRTSERRARPRRAGAS